MKKAGSRIMINQKKRHIYRPHCTLFMQGLWIYGCHRFAMFGRHLQDLLKLKCNMVALWAFLVLTAIFGILYMVYQEIQALYIDFNPLKNPNYHGC